MTAPVSSAAAQNGSRSAASSTLPMPRGKVEIIRPGKPAAIADLSTAAARTPSCSGATASGTKRGSALAMATCASLISRHQASPSAAVLDQAQRGKARALLADGGEQVRRYQMAVGVDDHRNFPFLLMLSSPRK